MNTIKTIENMMDNITSDLNIYGGYVKVSYSYDGHYQYHQIENHLKEKEHNDRYYYISDDFLTIKYLNFKNYIFECMLGHSCSCRQYGKGSFIYFNFDIEDNINDDIIIGKIKKYIRNKKIESLLNEK